MELRSLFQIRADVSTPQVSPGAPYGDRRMIPVIGGEITGDRLSGQILSGGSDSQVVRQDGVADINVRFAFETNDGVVVYASGAGLRHGPADVMAKLAAGEEVDKAQYYFREFFLFEAPPGRYEWLNRVLALGTGERKASTVLMEVYEVL